MSDVLEQAKRILEAREKATPAPLRAEGMGSEGYNLYPHLEGSYYRDHYDRLGFHGEIGRIHSGRDWKQLRGNAEYIEMAWNHAPVIARALIETQQRLDAAVELLRSSIEWCEVCDCTGVIDSPSVDDINFVGESDKPCPACREPIVNFLASIEAKGDGASELSD